MGERRGTKGLELWCKKMTEGYPGVRVDNMTTSWRDGLAFCALIHHFRPDLIDFSKLKKEDVYYNNDLAFRVAKQYLGIPALLEPQDMVECPVPDRLCILTYLSQFYKAFAGSQGPNARIASKRPVQTSPDHGIVSPVSTSPPTKVAHIGAGRVRREPCAKCKLPVFIAERLNVGILLYHRACFRCARCDSQLTPANYYETENGEFCCEICPDEEKTMNAASSKQKLLQKALSDEEKTASLKSFSNNPDDYSAVFETALESLQSEQGQPFTSARSKFFQTQLDSPADDSGTENEPPDLPDSVPPEFPGAKVDSGFPSVDSTVRLSVDVTKDDEQQSDTSLVRARMRLFERNNDNNPTVKSDVHRVSKSVALTKPAVPIAKLDEFNNFDDQFGCNKDDIKDAIKTEEEIKEEGAMSPVEEKEPIPLITDENKIVGTFKDESIEAVQIMDDAVNNLMVSISDDNKNEMLIKKSEPEPQVIPIEEPKFQKETKQNEVLVPDSQTEVLDFEDSVINLDSSKESSQVGKDDSVILVDSSSKESSQVGKDDSVILIDTSSKESSQLGKDDSVILVDSPNVIVVEDSPAVVKVTTPEEVTDESYPIERKPFDDDDEEGEPSKESDIRATSRKGSFGTPEKSYPDQLNPFGDEDEEEDQVEIRRPIKHPIASPRFKKKLMVPQEQFTPPTRLCHMVRVSINPFESEDEEDSRSAKPTAALTKIGPGAGYNPFESDEEGEPLSQPQPAARRRRSEMTPKISLNQYGRDGETLETSRLPVPTPRLSRTTAPLLEPDHKEQGGLSLSSRLHYGSNSSISSGSMCGSARKKKPAPRPPILPKNEDSIPHSLNSSPSHSIQHSPRSTPKHRKAKKAPPPPSSTPIPPTKTVVEAPVNDTIDISAIRASSMSFSTANVNNRDVEIRIEGRDAEKEKIDKDEENRNKQSMTSQGPIIEYPDRPSSLPAPNKSTYGKWKRKKDQAPSLPIPQKRTIKVLPMAEIKRELELIEKQQQGLERQGVRLEQLIREKCEGEEGEVAVANSDDIPIDAEDLILQLFELVNEKNELFRKQAELMYLRRQQRLEEEHADVEYQIRCLMLLPETKKTDSDKAREEELIKRLVDIVERRNDIIDCLEMDRIREAEEDDSINSHITLYTSKRDEDEGQKSVASKDKKKEEKKKKKHDKKNKDKDRLDIDKDVDESEGSFATMEKKKKKFKLNIF